MPANHREQQLMQHLRGGAWVGAELSYRITKEGLAAKKARVRIYS